MALTQDFICKCVALAPQMLKLPVQHLWLDYDQEADVLYLTFRKPIWSVRLRQGYGG